MNNEIVNREELIIDELLLDWNNPRLRSRYKEAYKQFKPRQKEKILMCNLIAYFNLEDLIKDILMNSKTSKHVFMSDSVIVQKSEYMSSLYNVKEGNRRVASLKILKSYFCEEGKILSDIFCFMTENDLFDEELEKNFLLHKKNIHSDIQKNIKKSDGKILSIPCNVYENSEEANKILKNVLRRMHVETKRKWEAIDKRLFDYNDIIIKIQSGVLTVEEAIKELLIEENQNGSIKKGLLKSEKNEFISTAFYHYILENIDSKKLGNEIILLKDRLLGSFLPVCEVFRRGLLNTCGIGFGYEIEDKQLKYKLYQEENFPVVRDKEAFVNECVKIILNIHEKRAISNLKYKNTKADNMNSDKTKTTFYIFFKDVINKYTDEEVVKDEEDTCIRSNPSNIYLKNNLNDKTIEVHIPSQPINLKEKILKVIDTNGEEVEIDKVDIYVDDKLLDRTGILETQTVAETKMICYKYIDSNDKLMISIFYIHFKDFSTPAPHPEVLFQQLSTFDKILIPDLKENLIKEMNKMKITEYKTILSLTLRCLYEISVKALYKFDKYKIMLEGKNATEKVECLMKYIHNNFDSKNKCQEIADYYKIDSLTIRDHMTSYTINYKEYYVKTNAAMHGEFLHYSIEDIKNYAKYARNWVYILNFLYYKEL